MNHCGLPSSVTLALAPEFLIAAAAATAPNPNKPPFYLDMPFEIVDGEAQIVPEVFRKVNSLDPINDVNSYPRTANSFACPAHL